MTITRAWRYAILLWLICGATAAQAEPLESLDYVQDRGPMSLSIDQALSVAEERNPRLKAELAKSMIADGAIVSARALPNPILMSDNGIAEDSYRLGIQQTILLGGKIKNRVEIARAERERLSAEQFAVLLQLRKEVRMAYADLYVAHERQRIITDLVAHYHTFYYKAPTVEDRLQVEFIHTASKNDLRTALLERGLAANKLNCLLSNAIDTSLTLERPRRVIHNNYSRSQILAAAHDHSPEILQNKANVREAAGELALARSNKVPNFTFAVGPDVVTPPEVTQTSFFAIGYLDLPVLNRQRGPIQEAIARRSQLGLERSFVDNQTSLAVANAYETYKYTLERLTEFESEIIPRALDLQAQARAAVHLGNLTVDTLVEADTHRANMELAYLSILRQNQEAISNLELASGLRL